MSRRRRRANRLGRTWPSGARLSQGRIHTRSPDVCERIGPRGCGYETRLLGGLGLVHARPVCAIEATEEDVTAVSTPSRLVAHGNTASSLCGAGVAARTVGRSGSVRPGDHFATPSRTDSVRMWKWLCDRDDLRQPGTNWATPSRADSIYMCFVIDTTNLRQPGTSFSHTLPSRFARRLRRLTHPSHALPRPPSATSRGVRHRAVRLSGGQSRPNRRRTLKRQYDRRRSRHRNLSRVSVRGVRRGERVTAGATMREVDEALTLGLTLD